jgi:hypothetical protein
MFMFLPNGFLCFAERKKEEIKPVEWFFSEQGFEPGTTGRDPETRVTNVGRLLNILRFFKIVFFAVAENSGRRYFSQNVKCCDFEYLHR